ncbi:MAG: L-2-amino-thiazoline-4-carboxylic acid hydrolase [Candidatus Hermodarchaeota archaeon]
MGKIRLLYDENTKIRFKIRDIIQTSLSALEAFLDSISKNYPDLISLVIKNLTSKFQKIKNYNLSLNLELTRFQDYPRLMDENINMILSLVKFTKYQEKSIDEEIDIEVSDLIHTFNHFEYCFVESLMKILPFGEVINYYQNFLNDLTKSKRNPDNYIENMQDLADHLRNFSERWHDLEAILEIINEEKMVCKVTKCRWAEDLKDIDPEIGYTMMCHQDFERAKNFNPNFVLTRNHTLMKGDEYCDFCYHDIRNNKDIIHPSDDFWDEFN